jgi:hypothetical protein
MLFCFFLSFACHVAILIYGVCYSFLMCLLVTSSIFWKILAVGALFVGDEECSRERAPLQRGRARVRVRGEKEHQRDKPHCAAPPATLWASGGSPSSPSRQSSRPPPRAPPRGVPMGLAPPTPRHPCRPSPRAPSLRRRESSEIGPDEHDSPQVTSGLSSTRPPKNEMRGQGRREASSLNKWGSVVFVGFDRNRDAKGSRCRLKRRVLSD